MRLKKYILKDRIPITEPNLIKWGLWMANLENRRVRQTTIQVNNEKQISFIKVSTVFLGIDHNFMGGRPLLFETMVFGHHTLSGLQLRYVTWKEAEKSHDKIVKKLSNNNLIEDKIL